MELNLAEKSVVYMRKILKQDKTIEESMEFVLPDSLPDLGEILWWGSTLTVRQKEKRGQDICVSGGLMVQVLYRDETAAEVKCTDAYLPFSVKVKEVSAEAPQIVFDAAVSSLNARILGPRKFSLRAFIHYRLCVYETADFLYTEVTDAPPCLQLRTQEYRMVLPEMISEKDFTVSESLTLQNALEKEDVFCCFPRLCVMEKRLAGDKVVFKGNIALQILIISPEGIVKTEQTNIPFSQYCALDRARQEAPAELTLSIASFEVQHTTSADGDRILIEAQLCAQALVYEEHCLQFYDDAYTTSGTLEATWRELSAESLLDNAQLGASCTEESRCECNGVCCAVYAIDFPAPCEEGGLCAPLTANILCTDGEGKLFGTVLQGKCILPYEAAENVDISSQINFSAEPSVQETAEGLQLQCTVKAEIFSMAEQSYRCPESMRLQSTEEKRKVSCVTIRRLLRDEKLWDIAKANSTTVEELRRANRLEGDTAEAQTVLIIPTP